jgi:hypothetical protein
MYFMSKQNTNTIPLSNQCHHSLCFVIKDYLPIIPIILKSLYSSAGDGSTAQCR